MKLSTLAVLSEKEIKKIHEASLDILEQTGLLIEDDKVLNILKEAGCEVDFGSQRAKFPRKIVMKTLSSCPKSFPVLDRDGNTAFVLGEDDCVCGSGHNAVFTMIDESGERRDAKLSDVKEFSIVSDALSEVDIIGVPFSPQDVNLNTSLLYAIKQILDVSKKPIFFSCESDIINNAALEMCKTILGVEELNGRSNLISQLSTTSPLYWERGAVRALHKISEAGMPVAFLPQPIAGVTAPFTVAGLLTVHNTEVLSGIAISQIINPGLPVIYACAWTTYDMQRTNVLIGRPESSMLRIAGAQMAKFYNIPSHTTAPDNDSNLHDEQGAWEKMLSTICGIGGENSMIMNLGMLGTGMTITTEQLIMDNEICRIVRRLKRGIEVTDESIAADVIKKVGPKDIFMMEEHTLINLRSGEHALMDVSNGANYGVWREEGKISSADAANSIKKSILEKGIQNPLDDEKSARLADIIAEYEKQF